MEFTLNPKRVATIMLGIIAVLTIMHVTQLVIYFQIDDPDVFDFIKIIDFGYEVNFPTFYSSTAILFCAILLWVISLQKRREKAPFNYHWIGLAIIFTFLSLDEAIALHEEIGDFVEEHEWVEAEGFLFFAWVAPYGILLGLFAISYFKFVFALPRQTMILFLGAGIIFVSGAMGIEAISAREADLNDTDTLLYTVLYTVEELFEMVGIVIFSYALLRYIEDQGAPVQFHVNSNPNSPSGLE